MEHLLLNKQISGIIISFTKEISKEYILFVDIAPLTLSTSMQTEKELESVNSLSFLLSKENLMVLLS